MEYKQDEAALVRRAVRGDPDAFGEIMSAYEKLVYNVARRSVSSAADAEDILQETFLKAWRALPSFRFECSLATWLCRIAMNCCVDHARTAKRHAAVSLTVCDDETDSSRILDVPATDVTVLPEEEIVRREEIRAVRRAIDALPDEQRLLVTLRDLGGLSYAEIGELLALTPGTVKSRLHRARAFVGKYLTERNFFGNVSSKETETDRLSGDQP